jgi:ATP-dependent protease ClpP protease subunit
MSERPWYSIRSAAESEAVVYIYDEIGGGLFEEGVTAKAFVSELGAISAPRIALHVNSPGGSVFQGQAIFNAIAGHPATVTTYIDGVAASIASVVALAGERVVMARNALFMIHDPFLATIGTAAELRKAAELLDQVAATIRATYVAKTGQDEQLIAQAMAEETWFGAEEAAAWGFADEVADPLAVAASGARTFDLSRFRNAPVRRLATPDLPPEPAAEADPSAPAAEAAGPPTSCWSAASFFPSRGVDAMFDYRTLEDEAQGLQARVLAIHELKDQDGNIPADKRDELMRLMGRIEAVEDTAAAMQKAELEELRAIVARGGELTGGGLSDEEKAMAALRAFLRTGEPMDASLSTTDANGGYIVPEPAHAQLIEKVRLADPVFGRATLFRMSGDTVMQLPYKSAHGVVGRRPRPAPGPSRTRPRSPARR